jgi:hypothetical protein
MNSLERAAQDARYLVDRGYPKDSAINFVSNHYCLPKDQRAVLIRVIVESALACARKAKALSLEAFREGVVFVDGYNVLITVESQMAGYPVYQCDDGFLRDTRGVYGSYKCSEFTVAAIFAIMDLLALATPSRVEVLLDQQMSRSGVLAEKIRSIMAKRCLPGDARTAPDVDHLLKTAMSIVATSDGNVIDAASHVVDLPAEMARMRGIDFLTL